MLQTVEIYRDILTNWRKKQVIMNVAFNEQLFIMKKRAYTRMLHVTASTKDCIKIFENKSTNSKLKFGKELFYEFFEKEKEYNSIFDLAILMNHSKYFLNHSEGKTPELTQDFSFGKEQESSVVLNSEYEKWFRGQVTTGPRDLFYELVGIFRPTIHQ